MPRKSSSFQPRDVSASSPSPMAKSAILPDEVKRFIIGCLACGDAPGEAARAVRTEFGLRLSRQRMTRYDPRWPRGKALCAPFQDLFFVARREFALAIRDHPHAEYQIKIHLMTLTNEAMDRARDGRPISRAFDRVRCEEKRVETMKAIWEKRREKARRALFPDGVGLIGAKTDLSNLSRDERALLARLDANCRAIR